MPVRIPKAHEGPLRELMTMESDMRGGFLEAIRSAKPVIDPSELISVVTSTTQIPEKSVTSIVWMLISMYRAPESSRKGFAAQVVDAARDLADTDDVDWAGFQSDLEQLLGCDESLGVTAKVTDVRREYGHVYCSARILTDIRPVFGEDPTQAPLAGAIVHTLRVTYHETSGHKDFHVALDASDLRELRTLVDRATKKEASLKGEIAKTEMQYLGLEIDS